MLFVYGLVSKAYSHPAVRLKKYPIGGWLVAGVFQGIFTFMMCYVGLNIFAIENALTWRIIFPGLLSTIMLWANYPMTQIYQHEEDAKRGDLTLSRMLGVRGTFYFVGTMFSLVTIGFIIYFITFFSLRYVWVFLGALGPVVIYFFLWFIRVYKDETKADYQHTMWLNFISATCLNAFFIYLFMDRTQLAQLFQ